MSRAAPARESRRTSTRGPLWDQKSIEIRIRDGGYRDAQGRFHGVCRNWLEAKRQGMLEVLPRGCQATNGEDEVWACHGAGWNTHPALRFVDENIIAFCRHCDPDRNIAVRPLWWGSPKHPIKAGWERTVRPDRWSKVGLALLAASVVLFAIALNAQSHQRAWFEGAFTALAVSAPMWWVHARTFLASLELGTLLWVALLVLDGWLRRYPTLRPYLLGQPKASFSGLLAWLVALLVLEGACLVLCYVALSSRWLSRGGHTLLHALARLARWAKP